MEASTVAYSICVGLALSGTTSPQGTGPGPLRRRRESAPSFPAPSLSRRVSTRDTDCWSWGPPPLSTDRSSRSAGPSERSRTRWRDRSCWSPPAISTLISEKKLSRVEVLPLLLWVSAVSYSLFCLSGTCRYCQHPAHCSVGGDTVLTAAC